VKLHEFQAKQVLAQAGIAVPAGRVATTAAQAEAAAAALGLPVVVKAQVHAGGRGKAGGVKLAKTAAEARAHAQAILGMDIKGHTVEKVYVERAAKIAQELYLGVTIDRDRRRPVVMLSTVGGMDIEEVAATEPEKIARGWPDPLLGFPRFRSARALLCGSRPRRPARRRRPRGPAALCGLHAERRDDDRDQSPLHPGGWIGRRRGREARDR